MAIWLLGSGTYLLAQNHSFTRINSNHGLINNTIYALEQDQFGYMWVGTRRGLQRLDGTSIVTYQYDPISKNSIAPGYVRSIFEDNEGAIWVGTEQGLSKISGNEIETLLSIHYEDSLTVGNGIEDIVEWNGKMYFATWGEGLVVYDGSKFSKITESDGLSSNILVDLLVVDDVLWIGTWDGGLCRMENNIISCENSIPGGFNSSSARCLAYDPNEKSLWIGTWGNGLYQLKDGKYNLFNLDEENNIESTTNKVLDLIYDNVQNTLWIGTFGGGLVKCQQGKFEYIKHKPNDINSLSSDFIESFHLDNDNKLWVGTNSFGISKKKEFGIPAINYYKPDRGIGTLTKGMIQLGDEVIGVPGSDGKIKEVDTQTARVLESTQHQYFDYSTTFSSLYTSDGTLYMGGEMSKLIAYKDGKYKLYQSEFGDDYQGQYINSIFEDNKGIIWVASSLGGGLHRVNGEHIESIPFGVKDSKRLPSKDLISIHQSTDGLLWLSTWNDGLISYDGEVFKQYKHIEDDTASIISNRIYCSYESNDGKLWLGTESGLELFDREKQQFKHFTNKDGLFNEEILSIGEHEGKLLLCTRKRISVFDPKNQSFTHYRDHLTREFSLMSPFYQDSQGNYYVIATDGYLKFKPGKLKKSPFQPKVGIINFLVDNEVKYLPKRIEQCNSLTIPQGGFRNLFFEFSSMDLDFESSFEFSYQLNGYDDDWVDLGPRNSINFTSLASGTYELLVKSSLDGAIWSPPKSIEIVISKAWYETWLFKIILVAIVTGLIWILVVWRNIELERRKYQLEKLVQRKTKAIRQRNKQLREQSKLLEQKNKELEEFAYVASHDLQSPLHTIKGWVGLLKDNLKGKLDEDTGYFFDSISNTADRMSNLIKGLLEHSRIGRKVVFSSVDCNEVLKSLKSDLSRMIKESSAEINVGKLPKITAYQAELTLLFQNLITNAIKFRKPDQHPLININCTSSKNFYKFSICDNGIGIKEQYREKVFGIFERLHNHEEYQGTGIGLAHCKKVVELHGGEIWVESEYGKGSSFSFTISKHL